MLQGLGQSHADFEGDQLGDAVDEAVGVAHDPSHVAHHRLGGHGPVSGDLRDFFPAVFFGDVVDDLVALVHAEVDIEVGHGHPFGIQEALEQQVVGQRIQIGDSEGVGHQGTGARTASRAHGDPVVLGPLDEVGDDQKVAGKAHLDDNVQFDLQTLVIGLAGPGEIGGVAVEEGVQALFQALARLPREEIVHGHAVGDGEIRQVVFAQAQFQVAALGDFDAVLQSLGEIGEQFRHLLRRAQVLLLRIGLGPAGIVQHPSFHDADPGLVGLEILR